MSISLISSNPPKCPQCLAYANHIKIISREFKSKNDALSIDNNILKRQIEKSFNNIDQPVNYQDEINKLKQNIDLLLLTNENNAREIEHLKIIKSTPKSICASCSKPLKELQEKIIDSNFFNSNSGENIDMSVYTHMEAVYKKYIKLETSLNRERTWTLSLKQMHDDALLKVDTLTNENNNLKLEVSKLNAKLTDFESNKNETQSSKCIPNKKEAKTALPMSKLINKCKKLLVEIPNLPNEKFQYMTASKEDIESLFHKTSSVKHKKNEHNKFQVSDVTADHVNKCTSNGLMNTTIGKKCSSLINSLHDITEPSNISCEEIREYIKENSEIKNENGNITLKRNDKENTEGIERLSDSSEDEDSTINSRKLIKNTLEKNMLETDGLEGMIDKDILHKSSSLNEDTHLQNDISLDSIIEDVDVNKNDGIYKASKNDSIRGSNSSEKHMDPVNGISHTSYNNGDKSKDKGMEEDVNIIEDNLKLYNEDLTFVKSNSEIVTNHNQEYEDMEIKTMEVSEIVKDKESEEEVMLNEKSKEENNIKFVVGHSSLDKGVDNRDCIGSSSTLVLLGDKLSDYQPSDVKAQALVNDYLDFDSVNNDFDFEAIEFDYTNVLKIDGDFVSEDQNNEGHLSSESDEDIELELVLEENKPSSVNDFEEDHNEEGSCLTKENVDKDTYEIKSIETDNVEIKNYKQRVEGIVQLDVTKIKEGNGAITESRKTLKTKLFNNSENDGEEGCQERDEVIKEVKVVNNTTKSDEQKRKSMVSAKCRVDLDESVIDTDNHNEEYSKSKIKDSPKFVPPYRTYHFFNEISDISSLEGSPNKEKKKYDIKLNVESENNKYNVKNKRNIKSKTKSHKLIAKEMKESNKSKATISKREKNLEDMKHNRMAEGTNEREITHNQGIETSASKISNSYATTRISSSQLKSYLLSDSSDYSDHDEDAATTPSKKLFVLQNNCFTKCSEEKNTLTKDLESNISEKVKESTSKYNMNSASSLEDSLQTPQSVNKNHGKLKRKVHNEMDLEKNNKKLKMDNSERQNEELSLENLEGINAENTLDFIDMDFVTDIGLNIATDFESIPQNLAELNSTNFLQKSSNISTGLNQIYERFSSFFKNNCLCPLLNLKSETSEPNCIIIKQNCHLKSLKTETISKKTKINASMFQKLDSVIKNSLTIKCKKDKDLQKVYSAFRKNETSFDCLCTCFFKIITGPWMKNNFELSSLKHIFDFSIFIFPHLMEESCDKERGLDILKVRAMEAMLKVEIRNLVDIDLLHCVIGVSLCVLQSMQEHDRLVAFLVDILLSTNIPVYAIISLIDLGFVDYNDPLLSNFTENWFLIFLRFLYQHEERKASNIFIKTQLSERGSMFWSSGILDLQESHIYYFLQDILIKYPQSIDFVNNLYSIVINRCV